MRTLGNLVTGPSIFLDANILVYHFQPHSNFGPACQQLMARIEQQDVQGFTSTALATLDLEHGGVALEMPQENGDAERGQQQQAPPRIEADAALDEQMLREVERGEGRKDAR